MSTTTPNLGLFKYNTTTDANVAFNINNALNNNWDKIDSAMAGGGLPDQTDKAGYLLTTNGSEASWVETLDVHVIIETFIDGTSWYRVYSDGWCEQGGKWQHSSGTLTLNLLKPYKDTNYSVIGSYGNGYNAANNNNFVLQPNTPSQITLFENNAGSMFWQACGYIEE